MILTRLKYSYCYVTLKTVLYQIENETSKTENKN